MTSRCIVFDHRGNQITDILGNFRRSWVADDIGRCDFDFPTDDPKCTQAILNYGNFLLIQHIPTKDALGNTQGQLPDWVGVIYPPRDWNPGLVKCTAFSAEKVLERRAVKVRDVTGSPGACFREILKDANSWGYFPVHPGTIALWGAEVTEPLVTSAHAHAKHLAETYNMDWDVTGRVDANGKLQLYGNWYRKKGADTGYYLTDGPGGNVEFSAQVLSEQGEIANDVVGHGSTPAAKQGKGNADVQAHDDVSIGQYGGFMSQQTFNVTGQGATNKATEEYVKANSQPIVTMRPNILDRGKVFDYVDIGNTFQAILTTAGFYGGELGFNGKVRLIGFEYDDAANKVGRVTAKVE